MSSSPDGARRAPVVSPLVMADADEMPPGAKEALLTDPDDHRRVVLVELRLRVTDS
jgi:hypothetical protein